MSASDKKKIRKEQKAEKITQKQKQAQQEAKKLKTYTIAFISVMVAIVLILALALSLKWYERSGIAEKKTIAATIGDYEMNTVEMAYYYNDAINEFYSSVYSYVSSYAEDYFEAMGLDLTKPLNKQTNPETNDTWANYFIDAALESAQSDFAMYNLAMEAGYKLTEEEQLSFNTELKNLENTAKLYGGTKAYLTQIYGNGADMKSYSKYLECKEIATSYYNNYYEGLTYTDEEIRAYEEDKYNEYSSFSYAYVYMSYKDFLEGGTKNDSGTVEYTEEENEAARAKLKAAAESLQAATSLENLHELVKEVKVIESSTLTVTEETDNLYANISGSSETLAKWFIEESREENEMGLVAVEAEITDEETEEKKTVTNGYYVVYFLGVNDNTKKMSNVRHILIKPDGGSTDENGNVVYSDTEQATAYTEAEALLASWKSGEATEATFIELVKEHTDDTASAEDGGLYTELHPDASYEPAFLAWAVDPSRQAGDTDIVQTDVGQHIMYYAGDAEQTYRDYMISVDMSNEEIEEFYNTAIEATVATKKNLSKLNLSLVIAG